MKLNDILKSSDKALELLFHNIRDAIACTDIQGCLVAVNQAFLDLFGYPQGEVVDKNLELLIHRGPLDTDHHSFFLTVLAGKQAELQGIFYGKQGLPIEALIKGMPIISGGNTIASLYMFSNTGGDKQLEDLLRQREERYRFLAENMGDIIWVLDLDFNTIYVSPSVNKVLGYTPEERKKQTYQEIMTPESQNMIVITLQQELAKEAAGDFDPDRHMIVNVEYYHKDGHTVWTENLVKGLRDEQGTLIGIYGVTRDITAKKEAEMKLAQSEKLYRTLIETQKELICRFKPDTTLTFANRAYLDYFNMSEEDIGCVKFLEFVPEDEHQFIKKHIQKGLEGKEPLTYEHEIISSSKKTWQRWTDYPLLDEAGEVTEFQSHGYDITEMKEALLKLEASEAKLNTLIDQTPAVIYSYTVIDGKPKLNYINENVIKVLGYKPAEFTENLNFWYSRVHHDDLPALKSKLQGNESYNEYRFKDNKGCYHWLADHQRVMSKEKDTIEIIGAWWDITSRKQMETKLLSLKTFSESIIKNITEGIIISDLNGNVTFANPALLQMLGYSAKEFIGSHWTAVVPATHHQLVEAADTRRLEGNADRYELVFKHKNGALQPFQVSGSPYHDHATGKLAGTIAVLTDISERKKTEEVLKASEERIRLMTRNIKDVVVETDANGYYTYVSDSGSAVLGYSQELIGKRTFDYIHPDDVEQVLLSFAQVAGSNKTARVEYRFRHPERGYIWVEGTGGAYQNSTNETVVLVTVRDISERKKAEEELRYLSLHDQLTGIFNRHFFEGELRRFAGSREYPISIVLADLDGLKLINDTLGHSAGDSQLLSCAKLLEKALRSSDILARVGGDEFALLLPHTTKEAGEKLVARIRHHIELYNQTHVGLPLSISIGLAVCETGDSSLIEAYRSADSAMYQDKLTRSKGARHAIIKSLMTSLYDHDQVAGKVTEQVKEYCFKLGQALNLNDSRLANLKQLARVRDLGNITLAGQLLQKNGSLTEKEFELIRQHAEAGYRIVTSSPELAGIADLVLKHHENFDGTGYPLGLKGNDIPIECRIVAVCAAYCAMVNPRSYARTFTPEEAGAEFQRCTGTLFDPQVVKAFMSIIENVTITP